MRWVFALLRAVALLRIAGAEEEIREEDLLAPWTDSPGDLGLQALSAEEVEELRALAVADTSRRLQYVTTLEDMPLPDNHVLYMVEGGSTTSWTCSSFCTAIEGAHAGANYTILEIKIPGGTFQFTTQIHRDARLKVVDNTLTEPQARDGQCRAGEPLVAEGSEVQGAWGQSLGSATSVRSADTLRADDTLVFRMGGNYRFCYSANGTFGLLQADITRQRIEVNGVFDRSPSCMTDDCLTNRIYQCYMRREEFNTADGRYGLQSSCIIDYSYPGAGFYGPIGRGTWTAEFGVTFDEQTGAVTSTQAQPCAFTEPASFICRDGGACDAGDPYIEPDSTVGSRRINIPTTRNDLFGNAFGSTTTFNARTVAACYCPDRDGCTSTVDFIQQIGILHFYLSKVCHAGSTTCAEDFTGVTGQYRFRVRVECPTNACMMNDQNRVKLVEKSLANDLPSWDAGNGCRTGLHGILGGLEALPTTLYVPIDGSPQGNINEMNCDAGSPVGCRLSGGVRQDYKTFGGTYGFRFVMGTTNHEARGFHTSKEVDMCYCNSDCDVAANWFKVGSMRLSSTRLVSAATSRSDLPAQWSVEFVNQPGIIGLYRPYADGGVLGLQENGVLKLVTDKDKQLNDDGCALSGYNSQFSQGLSSEVAASTNYLGKLQTQTPPDLQKVVFNSNSFVNTITVTEAGTLAVCYCAMTVDSICVDSSNWKLVTHLTVKGPQINQRWTFSTNVVFRFSYEGFGLTSGDTIRIISSDGRCTDDNFNPNTAAFAYTALKVKCPVPCTDVTLTGGTEPGDLSTKVLSADSYNCDVSNENCETNDITTITVLSETETELVFQKPHGMMTGDEITLGANIFCAPGDPVCTEEMLTALKGSFAFADASGNSGTAPDTYIAAQKFIATENPLIARIQIGWPSTARPMFTIIYAGARPEIGYIGRGGLWTHHSRAQTREEVMATAERANLRVCWRFGGNGAKYVEEIGKMTIRNPATMLGATISMSSPARQTAVPMILTFTTAGGVTGMRYEEAQDSLRLKIVFLQTNLLDIRYADLAGSEIPFTVAAEDDFHEASQSICGKLFLELWSADMERGFPMPKGCYYKGYPTGNRREVFVVFEGKNGLRQSTTYQMVFNGIVNEDLDPPINNQVVQFAELVEIFPMDDVTSRPYEAIERGLAMLTTEPQSPSRVDGTEDPRFAVGGFKILGGYQDLLPIVAGDSLNIEMMGWETTAGRIQGLDIIRIFLWPLTQWQTTSSCTAECIASGEISFLCGQITSCLGLPTVPGMALNILRITLPSCVTAAECQFDDLYGNRKVRIRIGGVTIPSGGFFAQRLAAQVTNEFDQRPNYVLSSGSYIWKEPNAGITVAKVVSQLGGGNAMPFRGDQMNVLYARLTLSSTIKARDDTFNDASFTITLPEGYTCRVPTAFEGINPWEAATTLPAFASQVPQGRGTPTDGTSTHGWTVESNKCIFTPRHPDGIVYAGSSLVVKITADNPSFALQRADSRNVWTVHYANRGFHQFGNQRIRQVTSMYRFSSAEDLMYQSNNAVLGIITDASCQPQVLSASTKKAVLQDLHFFFRTEQEVGPGGLVRLIAPSGFSFGQPCNASDLPAPYYATQANPADATLPLPGIMSCVSRGSELREAELRLERILHAGRAWGAQRRAAAYQAASQKPERRMSTWGRLSSTSGADGFPWVNARYLGEQYEQLPIPREDNSTGTPSELHWRSDWSAEELRSAAHEHVMLSWTASNPVKALPMIERGDGVYLYDANGKEYLDWTSQAVCVNLGHTVPEVIKQGINEQLDSLPYVYGGLGLAPVRAKLAKLLAEICPSDLTGFLFPSGGGEANEAAIRLARLYTRKHKIFTQYRSYHGASASSLGATGDFRRKFAESGQNGFVKFFNPQPTGFSWGTTDNSATSRTLACLEDQVLAEGPETIAAVMVESIVGAGGVLVPPDGYMEGLRALCDKYDILLICDEVMVGFGRTGHFFGFQHFEGVVPDIVTSAKGLTASFMPLAMVGVRQKIKDYFMTHPVGWGSTFHAHPVALACAYETVKYVVKENVVEHVKTLEPIMMEELERLVLKHVSVRQGRAVGLFGCLDLQTPIGQAVQRLGEPSPPSVQKLRQAMFDNGLFSLFRPPLLHCSPPLIITEDQLRDGFGRLSKALDTFDEIQKRECGLYSTEI